MDTISVKDILSPTCSFEKKYIPDLSELAVVASKVRNAGYRIGIVGGVWDLFHIGHAKYLQLAKSQCDVLIVVVDSDELVRYRKGPSRPVVPEEERIATLHYLRSVDIITLRTLPAHSEDKEYLNKATEPDVCVLSTGTGDIPESQRAEIAKHAKRIVVFPPQAETSSSARIRLLAIDGAKPLADSVTELVEKKALAVAELFAQLPKELQVLIDSHMQKLNKV